jgi:hypothetical protein
MLRNVILAGSLAFRMAGADAAELTGILHTNRDENRATLETGDGLYLLDLGSSYLLDVGERHDRERVVVRGELSYPRQASRPVVRVDSITFRPHSGSPVTYSAPGARVRYAPPFYRHGAPYQRPRYHQYYTQYRH